MSAHEESGLERTVWSSADFAQMGWHDAQLHGLCFVVTDDDDPAYSVLLDLDYIVRWNGADSPETSLNFWVAPVTLAFDNAWDVRLSGTIEQVDMMDVLDLHHIRSFDNAAGVHFDEWHVDGDGFDLKLVASDFKQYFRAPPIYTESQRLGLAERHGVSFARIGFDGSV